MIRRVLEQCAQATGLDLVVLCTDSTVASVGHRLGVSGLANGGALQFSSERIASVADQLVGMAWEDTLSTGIRRHVVGLPPRL